MAQGDLIRFRQGTRADVDGTAKQSGQLLFATYEDEVQTTSGAESIVQGDIYFDLNNSTRINLANDVDKARTLFSGSTLSTDASGQWNANIDGVHKLYDGLTIALNLSTSYGAYYNTLNVNNLGDKLVWVKKNKRLTDECTSGSEVVLVYRTNVGSYTVPSTTGIGRLTPGATIRDGWVLVASPSKDLILPSAYCDVNAQSSVKTADCTNFSLANNSYIFFNNVNANTYNGALTININGTGAKSLYINGTASSATNYTLPAGTYILYYDGTNYYARTDGLLPGAGISGRSNEAASADKLKTAGTVITNLESNDSKTYTNGGNIEPGVKGILPLTHGGTGTTSFYPGALVQSGSLQYSAASAKGSVTLPIYIDSNGVAQTITSYEGNSNSATNLREGRSNNTDIFNWADTAANIHNTGTSEQLTMQRFFESTATSNSVALTNFHSPVIDGHNLILSIDNNLNHTRILNFDIRSRDIYTTAKVNGTWQDWVKLLNSSSELAISNLSGVLPTSKGGTGYGKAGLTINRVIRSASSGSQMVEAASLYTTGANLGINRTDITSGYVLDVNGSTKLGGSVSHTAGHIYLEGSVPSGSSNNTTQIIFGKAGAEHIALSANTNSFIINPNSTSTAGQLVFRPGAQSYIASGKFAINASDSGSNTFYVNGTSNLSGNTTISGTLGVSAATTLSSTLSVTGNSTFNNEVKVVKGGIWVQGGSDVGGDNTRLTLTSGMPTELKYNGSKRGTRLYSNGIAFADPYNGNSNNDSAWIRHIEETANSGLLEIATGDDSSESIAIRQYNASSNVAAEITLLNASHNSIMRNIYPVTAGSYHLGSHTLPWGQVWSQQGFSVKMATDTSNWKHGLLFQNPTVYTKTYAPGIGFHNTGETISIIPFETDNPPWERTEGLSVGHTTLLYNGRYVTTGNSVGNATKGVYVDSLGQVQPMTYSVTANINAGTAPQLAYYNSNNTISSTPHISYYNNILLSNSRNGASVDIRRNGLFIYGVAYGNPPTGETTTASTLLSNTPGVIRFNDGGPQIVFSTNSNMNIPSGAQAGALIFTDHDRAGGNASFHFVTNQNDDDYGGNLVVTAPTFRARRRLTVGSNTDNTSYTANIVGTTNSNSYTLMGTASSGNHYINGVAGRIYFGGNFHIDSMGTNKTYINYHTNNDVYIAAGSSKGKVGIGTTAPAQQLEVGGNARVSGHLEIGKADKIADTGYATDNVGVDNYISFYGTYNDGAGSFNHTYIGERIWGPKDTVNEVSELFIAKGNDLGGGGTSGTTVSGAGPDRIRYSAASHVFQTNTAATSGTFQAVAESSNWVTRFEIVGTRARSHNPMEIVSEGNTLTIGSLNASYAHFQNSTNRPFYFNKPVHVDNILYIYNQNTSLEPHYLHLGGATNSTMENGSTNPRITFTEGAATQPVSIIYTDQDPYRAPAGLKIVGGASAQPAWLEIEGSLYLGSPTRDNTGIYFNPYVESTTDSTDAGSIYQIKAGVAGGTELRISQQNDATDVINLCTNKYIYLNSKRVFTISDNWLRINEDKGFANGIYFGQSLARSDNQLQVGPSGDKFYANSDGNGYFSNTLGIHGTNTGYNLYVNGTSYFNGHNYHLGGNGRIVGPHGIYTATAASRYNNSALEIRENGLVGNAQSVIGYAPTIGFHWSGRIASTLAFHSDGRFYFRKQNGVDRADIDANLIGYLENRYQYDGTENWSSAPWHKVAHCVMTATYGDATITWLVSNGVTGVNNGILYARLRTGATVGVFEQGNLIWEYAGEGIDKNDFVFRYTNVSGTSCTAEVWCKMPNRWSGYQFITLDRSNRGGNAISQFGENGSAAPNNNVWIMENSISGNASANYTAGTDGFVSSFNNIVRDYNNGNVTRFGYSTSGMTSTSWLAAWDGYILRALSPTNNNIGALTAHRPLGFTSDSQSSATWGNQTGTGVTTWNDASGGSIEFRKDNPSSGKLSIKVDGRFYGNEGGNPAMLMNEANGYWGMGNPDGANNVWIRTTTQGIIPYQGGGVMDGHQYLGTSSWYFGQSYITRMYTHQVIVQGTVPSATTNAGEDHPRITFQQDTGTQPVHLMYNDFDSYRAPAGLKVVGGTSAAPAWFEVEGNIWIGNSANNGGPHLYLKNNTITKGTNPSAAKYSAIEFLDNSSSRTALIENAIDTNGDNWLNIWTTAYTSGSTNWSGIRLKKTIANALNCYIAGTTDVSGDVYGNSIIGRAGASFISSSAGTPWPYIRFDTRAGGTDYVTTAQSTWAQFYVQLPAKRASDNYYYKTRFFFRQYSKTANTTTRLSYYENYYLPETNDDLTANASYDILNTKNHATPSKSTATYMAYYSAASTISGTSNIRVIDGCLNLYPANGNYREGIRIHPVGSWSDITLQGNANNGNTSGISTEDWFIGNNNGNFYITRNGSSGSATDVTRSEFSSVGNQWRLRGYVQAHKAGVYRSGLHIYGPTYGNDAPNMASGTAGVFRWNDGGPQITFDTSATPGGAQAGALIFTDHDSGGAGTSFHFVSNQNTNNYGGDATVTAPRFRARRCLTINANSDLANDTYVLYVNGQSYHANTIQMADANIYLQRAGRGSSWINGRNSALVRTTTVSGYCALTSIKTTNGTWEYGTYNSSGWENSLLFTYCTDTNYNAGTNNYATQIRFYPEGRITSINGTTTQMIQLVTNQAECSIRTKGSGQGWVVGSNPGSCGVNNYGFYNETNGLRGFIRNDGEFCAAGANAFRAYYGNYGVILRNDGSDFYILLTNSGSARDGSWNSLRPFRVHLADGNVTMSHNVTVGGSLTASVLILPTSASTTNNTIWIG